MNLFQSTIPLIKIVFNFAQKAFLVVVVFTFIISLFFYFTSGKYKSSNKVDSLTFVRSEVAQKLNNPLLTQSKQGLAIKSAIEGTYCGFVGEFCTQNPSSSSTRDYFRQSIVGQATQLLILPYANPPASGVAWVYSSLENSGFVPNTYAAGIGFSAIQPYAKVWSAFRDVSYIVLVLVIVSIGFMIMFRMKLNPQTVISIENSLPKIVVALFLITFSFAIAGFLIDLMYMSIIMVLFILSKAGGFDVAQESAFYIQAQPLSAVSRLAGSIGFVEYFVTIPNLFINILGDFLGGFFRILTTVGLSLILLPIVGRWTGKLTPEITTGVGAIWAGLQAITESTLGVIIGVSVASLLAIFVPNLILGLLIGLTIILTGFRIFFMVLSAYIKIIFHVLLAPLILLGEAIPGRGTFGGWFRGLLSELAIFPSLVAIFALGHIIINIPLQTQNAFTPPFMVGLNPTSLSALIGLAILIMTPELLKMVKQTVNPKPLPIPDAGPGIFFGGATSGLSGAAGEATKYAGMAYYIRPLRGVLKGLSFGAIDINDGQHPEAHCLPQKTMIETENGQKQIWALQFGDKVASVNKYGVKEYVVVISTSKRKIRKGHAFIHIHLSDGRNIIGSPNHPTADGRLFKDIHVYDMLDNATVVRRVKRKTSEKYTYDILPASETGVYWANGVLIGSTISILNSKSTKKMVEKIHLLHSSYRRFAKFIRI